jgi:hypothetical protein
MNWFQEEEKEDDQVDIKILHERNKEIRTIEEDTMSISEIMQSLSLMIHDQGENLEIASAHVDNAVENSEDAVISLDKSLSWVVNMRGLIVDATTIVAGSGLGALGFIGGPVVGVPTFIGGLVTAASVIVIRRALSSK